MGGTKPTAKSASRTADNQYLVFRIANVYLANKLLDVREIVEPQELRPFPNACPYFKGICNVRGEIIGVVDLSQCCNLQGRPYQEQRLIIFETSDGTLAATVDELISVSAIDQQELVEKPPVKLEIKSEYIRGVSTINGNLITIIDLKRILQQEDMTILQEIKKVR